MASYHTHYWEQDTNDHAQINRHRQTRQVMRHAFHRVLMHPMGRHKYGYRYNLHSRDRHKLFDKMDYY